MMTEHSSYFYSYRILSLFVCIFFFPVTPFFDISFPSSHSALHTQVMMDRGTVTYDKSSDWWAVGIILYEMLFGETPFADDSEIVVFNNIKSMKVRPHCTSTHTHTHTYTHIHTHTHCSLPTIWSPHPPLIIFAVTAAHSWRRERQQRCPRPPRQPDLPGRPTPASAGHQGPRVFQGHWLGHLGQEWVMFCWLWCLFSSSFIWINFSLFFSLPLFPFANIEETPPFVPNIKDMEDTSCFGEIEVQHRTRISKELRRGINPSDNFGVWMISSFSFPLFCLPPSSSLLPSSSRLLTLATYKFTTGMDLPFVGFSFSRSSAAKLVSAIPHALEKELWEKVCVCPLFLNDVKNSLKANFPRN